MGGPPGPPPARPEDEFPDLPAPIRLDRKRVRAADNEPLERRFKEVYLGRQPGFVRRLFGAKAEPATAPARDVHLHAAELWIPVDFPHPLDTEDALGSPRVVGSVPRLRAELEAVNARAIKADDATLEQWSKDGPPEDGNFAELSRFGLASILSLARKADQRRQPMVMDY